MPRAKSKAIFFFRLGILKFARAHLDMPVLYYMVVELRRQYTCSQIKVQSDLTFIIAKTIPKNP